MSIKPNQSLAVKNTPVKIRSTATTAGTTTITATSSINSNYKTAVPSASKLQQQQQPKITAAAAKLYNSYDGAYNKTVKKMNANPNNNNNNNNQQANIRQQQQQQKQPFNAMLSTTFLNASSDVSKQNVISPQQQPQQQEQQYQQTEQKLLKMQSQSQSQSQSQFKSQLQQLKQARNLKAFNAKSKTSNSNSNSNVKRVNFNLPKLLNVSERVTSAGVLNLNTTSKKVPSPPQASVAKPNKQANNNNRSSSSSSSRGVKVVVDHESENSANELHARPAETRGISQFTCDSTAGSNSTTSLTSAPNTPTDSVESIQALTSYHSQETASVATSSSPACKKATNRSSLNNRKPAGQHQSNASVATPYKQIIYNGTYPIDMPLQSCFQTLARHYDPEANADATRLKYAHMLNDYDLDEQDILDDVVEEDEDGEEDDEEYDDNDIYDDDANDADSTATVDSEELMIAQQKATKRSLFSKLGIITKANKCVGASSVPFGGDDICNKAHTGGHHAVWSMQELIANPAIPLNYQKMCHEVEQSLTSFEKYLDTKALDQRSKPQQMPVRTFDIDAPIMDANEKKHI